MACRSFAEEDLSCPVCCDIFINPVLLSCSHSVCSSCIQRVWENKTLKECPLCRRTSSNDDPPLNLALRNLCESFLQESNVIQKSSSSSSSETVCSVHKEQLKLFCLDDQQPVCVVCRDSRKHTDHRFCPVDEAAADNKMKLGHSLGHLQKRLRIFENFKQTLDRTAQQIKIQTKDTEIQMKGEFKELHQFLYNEEGNRITALREEGKQKSQKMKEKIEETSRQISSLSSTIRDIEQQMKTEDVSFLQNFRSTLQRAEIRLPDPQNVTETISVPKHLSNLKLTVLQQMQDNVAKASYVNAELSGDLPDDQRYISLKYKKSQQISARSRRSYYNLDSKVPQSSGYECAYGPSAPLLAPVRGFKHLPPRPPKTQLQRRGSLNPPPPLGTQFQPRGSHPPEHNLNGGGATPVRNFTPKKSQNEDELENLELQNQEIQFPGVKNLVKKINEQMKM